MRLLINQISHAIHLCAICVKNVVLVTFIPLFISLFSLGASSSESETIVFGSNEKLVEQYVAQYVIENIYDSIGLKLQVVPLPPSRAKKANLKRRIDGEIARITPYGNDKPSLIRIEPSYYYLETAAYCLKDSTFEITKAEDLKGLSVASIRGVAHSDAATANLKNVYKLDSAMQLFEFLKFKRADVVIDTEINGRRLLQKDQYRSFIKRCGVFKRFELFNYINENRAEIRHKVSNEIRALQASGKLNELIKEAEKKALLLGPEHF